MFKKIITLALIATAAPVWAETINSLTTGFDYTTGKYGGTDSTSILYVPVTGKIQADNFFLKLTIPYISVTSSGDGVVRGVGKIRTTTTTKSTTQSGLGDVVASAGYTVFENEQLMLDLVGNVKFGTADADKNLGTGENDYSAQIDGFYSIGKKTSLFATAGYKILGAPAGITVNNIAYGTLGVSQKIGTTTSAGVMLDTTQSSSELSPGTKELTVFVSEKISQTLKIQAHLMKGFSDSSPDMGGGLMVTGTF